MRIAILDTENSNIECINGFLRQNFYEWNVVEYTTVFSLVTGIYDEYKGDVDAIMIHISASGDEKINMARDIQNYFPQIKVVFYSESNNLAEEIFIASPIYFIRLPFSKEKLNNTFERVSNVVDYDLKQTLSFRMKGKIFKLAYSSIRYIESSGRKVLIYADDGYYETYMTIAQILQKLPSYFVKCHRSYIVNIDKISKLGTEGIILKSQEFVPISRTCFPEVKSRFESRK